MHAALTKKYKFATKLVELFWGQNSCEMNYNSNDSALVDQAFEIGEVY